MDVWGRDVGFYQRRRQALVSRMQDRLHRTTLTGYTEGPDLVGRIRRANDSAELTCRRVQRASPVDAERRLQRARGKAAEEKPSTPMTPSRALSRIPKICLELNAGWWSYQWCHLYEARQVRRLGPPSTRGGQLFTPWARRSTTVTQTQAAWRPCTRSAPTPPQGTPSAAAMLRPPPPARRPSTWSRNSRHAHASGPYVGPRPDRDPPAPRALGRDAVHD